MLHLFEASMMTFHAGCLTYIAQSAMVLENYTFHQGTKITLIASLQSESLNSS